MFTMQAIGEFYVFKCCISKKTDLKSMIYATTRRKLKKENKILKKADTNECILLDFIYMKFKSNKNFSKN